MTIFEEIPNLNKNKCQLKTTVNKIANVTTWLAAASPDASALIWQLLHAALFYIR